MFTTDDIDLREIAKSIANSDKFDRDMVPSIPVIRFYDNKGTKLFTDNRRDVFYAFDMWVVAHKLQGYYCEIETEWWDDENTYQGSVGKRNYQKFYFNDSGKGMMSDFPNDIFRFTLECSIQINQIQKFSECK